MTARRSDQQYLSRYSSGGTTSYVGGRIGWWDRTVFTPSDTDITYTISTKYDGRPDKLAYDTYGRDGLAWFILQYNNIIDYNTEFVTGATIKLPTTARTFTELLTTNK